MEKKILSSSTNKRKISYDDNNDVILKKKKYNDKSSSSSSSSSCNDNKNNNNDDDDDNEELNLSEFFMYEIGKFLSLYNKDEKEKFKHIEKRIKKLICMDSYFLNTIIKSDKEIYLGLEKIFSHNLFSFTEKITFGFYRNKITNYIINDYEQNFT